MLCDHTGRQPGPSSFARSPSSPRSQVGGEGGGGMGWVRGSEGQPRRTSQSHFIASDARPGESARKNLILEIPGLLFYFIFFAEKNMHVRVLCICWAALAESELPHQKKYHFHLLRNCLEGSLETCAAGCVSCCLPEHIPSFCSSAY